MQTDNRCPSRLIITRLAKQFIRPKSSCTFASITILTSALLWPTQGYSLTLQQAEIIASQADPMVSSYQSSARALMDESISKNTLPDPKFRLGLFNLPIDSLSTSENPTTQLRLGIQQSFPRGDTLDLKQEQSEWLSKSASARAENEKLALLRDLRETYLHLFYQIEAGRIIKDTSALFEKLVTITEAQYAAGRGNQQNVIRADLELARLKDRTARIQSKEDEFRAQLAQWVGEKAWGEIDNQFPTLDPLPENLNTNQILTRHPLIKIESAKIESQRKMTDMAKQDYKPGFNAFIEYRKRDGNEADGSTRDDMLAAMVTMDIPLFTANRQDKNVSANEQKTQAAKFMRDGKLRMLKKMLEKDLAVYKRLGERETIYKEELLESAINNSSASLNAYQSGVTEFSTLMRARITELDVRLADLRITVDRKRAQARLLYITGAQLTAQPGEQQ